MNSRGRSTVIQLSSRVPPWVRQGRGTQRGLVLVWEEDVTWPQISGLARVLRWLRWLVRPHVFFVGGAGSMGSRKTDGEHILWRYVFPGGNSCISVTQGKFSSSPLPRYLPSVTPFDGQSASEGLPIIESGRLRCVVIKGITAMYEA